jgi:hypothetical protein
MAKKLDASIKKKLFSNVEKEVLKALESIEKSADYEWVDEIIKLGMNHSNPSVQRKIQAMIFDQKLSKGKDSILRKTLEIGEHPYRVTLLAALWNANIGINQSLLSIVDIAVKGSLEEAIECFTILEESDGIFEEVQLLDAQLLLKSYLSDSSNQSDPKYALLQDIEKRVMQLAVEQS